MFNVFHNFWLIFFQKSVYIFDFSSTTKFIILQKLIELHVFQIDSIFNINLNYILDNWGIWIDGGKFR